MPARIVPTNVKDTPINSEIMHAVIGQMSDGIWENSRKMENIWKGLSVTTDDNSNTISIKVDYPSELVYYDDDKVRDYFANKIKQIIKIEIDDGLNATWDRDCTASSTYLNYYRDVQVRDAYAVYDALKGRVTRRAAVDVVPIEVAEVGQTYEKLGKITSLQSVNVEGKDYMIVGLGSYNEPRLIKYGTSFRTKML